MRRNMDRHGGTASLEIVASVLVHANDLAVQHRSCIRHSGTDVHGEIGKPGEGITDAEDQLGAAMLYDGVSDQ